MRFAEPVVIDLSAVPPGLVAIIGENGAGKSTILDAGLAAPFLKFPSRDGVLADYATSNSAYLDAHYTVRDRHLRLRVNVDGIKRVSDAVLEEVYYEGAAGAEDNRPLNDGKVSTFKATVREIFPAEELLLASAFAAQNRTGSFVALDKKRRKELFSELLGLKHYARMAETAKACAALCENGRVRLAAELQVLASATTPDTLAQLERRRQELLDQVSEAASRREMLSARIADLEEQLQLRKADVDAYLQATARVDRLTLEKGGLQRDVDRCTADAAELVTRHARMTEELDGRTARLVADLDTLDREENAATEKAIADLQERIRNNEALLTDADAIRAADQRTAHALHAVSELRLAIEAAETVRDTAAEQIGIIDKALASFVHLRREREEIQKALAVRQEVPCGGTGEYAGCQFLTMATAAAERLPALERQLADEELVRKDLETWRTGRQEALNTITGLRDTIAARERAVSADKALVAKLPHLQVAESRITDLQAQIAEQQRVHQARVTDRQYRLAKYQADAVTEQARLDDTLTREQAALQQTTAGYAMRLGATMRELEAAVSEQLRLQDARQQADVLQAELDTAFGQKHGLDVALARLEADVTAVTNLWDAVERQRERLVDVSHRHDLLAGEGQAWQLLERAFGRDGLPTLEIDAAGPTVSKFCNELLEAAFGVRFSVELVTQEDKADGKGTKESFELLVLDNAAGGDVRPIADLSGGERTIVEEALRCALALYVNVRNDIHIGTLWRDESIGSLDPENATRYIAMLRRLLTLGGFKHCLFVSHNLEAAALADHIITVADGRVEMKAAA